MTDYDLGDAYRQRSTAILASYDRLLTEVAGQTLSDALRPMLIDELSTLAELFDELLAVTPLPAEMLSRVFLRLTPLLSLTSLYAEQARWGQAIFEAFVAGNLEIDAALLNVLTYSFDALGDSERAAHGYSVLLGLFEDHPDHPALGVIWFNLSLHHYRAGSLVEALESGEKSLEISQKSGDARGTAIALMQHASILRLLDEPSLALDCLRRAAVLLDTLGSSELELRYFETAALLLAEYHPKHAPAVFERGLALAEALHDDDTRARLLFNQAAYYHALGDLEAAREVAARSLSIYQRLGSHHAQEVRDAIAEWLGD